MSGDQEEKEIWQMEGLFKDEIKKEQEDESEASSRYVNQD